MTQITEITQTVIDTWPISGAATPATTGFAEMTGTVNHVEDVEKSTGEIGHKYISFAENIAGTIIFDPRGTGLADDEDYWFEFYLRCNKTGTPAATFLEMQKMGSGVDLFWMKYYVPDVITENTRDGLWGLASMNSMGGVFRSHGIQSTNTATSKPVMAFGEWYKTTVRVKYNASQGTYELYINGVLNTGTYGADPTVIAKSTFDHFQWKLPAMAGIQWDVTGPFRSWKGTDIPLRPDHDLQSSASLTKKLFMQNWLDAPNNSQGKSFAVSGTATIVGSDPDPTFGVTPHRIKASGSISQTMNADTIDDIGLLPYNSEGWSTIIFDAVYLPDGATLNLNIRDVGDTADILAFSVDAGRVLRQGTTILKTLDNDSIYSLMVHLNINGSATWSLIDLTKNFASVQTIWSGMISTGWIAQNIGKVKAAFVLGSSTAEYGPITVCEWWITQMVDSQVASDTPASLPLKKTTNRTGAGFTSLGDYNGIPNGVFKRRQALTALGRGLEMVNVILAQAGTGYDSFNGSNMANNGLDGMRGGIFQFIDGYSTHETDLIVDQSTQDVALNNATAYIQDFIDTLTPNGNKLILGTMHRRNYTTPNEFRMVGTNLINAMIRNKASTKQTVNQMLQLADYAKHTGTHEDSFPVDDVHYNAVGSANVLDIILNDVETPVVPASIVVNPESSTQFVNIRGVISIKSNGSSTNKLSQILNIIKDSTGKDLRIIMFPTPSDIEVIDDQGMTTFIINVYDKLDLNTIVKTITLGRNIAGIYIKANGLDDLSSLAIGEYYLVWKGVGALTQSSWFADPYVMKVIVTGSG